MPESQTHCDGIRIKALNNIYHEVKILFYLSVQMSIFRIFMYDVIQKVEKVFKFMYIPVSEKTNSNPADQDRTSIILNILENFKNIL